MISPAVHWVPVMVAVAPKLMQTVAVGERLTRSRKTWAPPEVRMVDSAVPTVTAWYAAVDLDGTAVTVPLIGAVPDATVLRLPLTSVWRKQN